MHAVEPPAVEKGLDRPSLLSSITAQGFYERLGYNPVRDVFHGTERNHSDGKPLAKAEA
jgi:hypothetical protein